MAVLEAHGAHQNLVDELIDEVAAYNPDVDRASLLAFCQRCHQRCAVAGDTLKAAAAAFSVIPPAIAETSA